MEISFKKSEEMLMNPSSNIDFLIRNFKYYQTGKSSNKLANRATFYFIDESYFL